MRSHVSRRVSPALPGEVQKTSRRISAGEEGLQRAREQRTPLSDISRAIFCDLSVAHHRRRHRRRRRRYAWPATKRKLLPCEQPIPVASRRGIPVS